MKTFAEIQQSINAPKNQVNKFGGYKYRSCEDILKAAKEVLGPWKLIVNDEIVEISGRFYVRATATCSLSKMILDEDGTVLDEIEESYSATAYARETDEKKGMDVAQVTGSASSYARKYALNGLFCIDDSQDPDTQDNRPPKVDYKKRAAQVETIGKLLGEKTQGLDKTEKAKFMQSKCGVKSFDQFSKMDNDKLDKIIDGLNAITTDEIPW